MRYLQCFPLCNARVLPRLLAQAVKLGPEVVLDLEDAVGSVQDEALNTRCKDEGRKILIGMAPFLMHLQAETKIHIRINAPETPHFAKDISYLKKLTGLKIESVVVPKAESEKMLLEVMQVLRDNGVLFRHISAIAETREGLEFFTRRFNNQAQLPIDAVYFGNYDYNLSTGQFPVIEQNNARYWRVVEPLALRLNELGIFFGNSPYVHLYDTGTFLHSIRRLKILLHGHFSQVCLNLDQTRIAMNEARAAEVKAPVANVSITEETETDLEFVPRPGRSFAFNARRNKITTPHEYLLQTKSHKRP